MRIGILTSGGDAPGMNAAIAGAADRAAEVGATLMGIRHGYAGLATVDMSPMTSGDAQRHRAAGGTWLRTSRWTRLATAEGLAQTLEAVRSSRLHGLVVLGGDGSITGARRLVEHGVSLVAIPATIDSGIPSSPFTLGHSSAVEYGVSVIEAVRTTGRSLPHRGFVLQTLGGDTGHLAEAVAKGAEVSAVLAPPDPPSLSNIASLVETEAADDHAVVVMAEAIGDAVTVSSRLTQLTGVRIHPIILGHAQRGVAPNDDDLSMGVDAGRAAVDALVGGGKGLLCLPALELTDLA